MSRLRTIIVTTIALIIFYVFINQAQTIGAPNIFIIMGGLMAVLIVLNLGRALLRGY